MDAFLLKKIVSNLVHVVPGSLLLILLAWLLHRWWPRTSRFLILAVTVSLLALSSPPVCNRIVSTLEDQHPVLNTVPPKTTHILVLGSAHNYHKSRPANSVLTATALSRLTEGVRLWKTHPTARLVTSGAKFNSEISHADAVATMAIVLGVPDAAIDRLDQTRDTADEIRTASSLLSEEGSLVIVSSATHLPRTKMLAQQQLINYELAPTDFLSHKAPWYRFNAANLNKVDRAVHEWIGMLWYRVSQMRQT